jgi:hypothetical protein
VPGLSIAANGGVGDGFLAHKQLLHNALRKLGLRPTDRR